MGKFNLETTPDATVVYKKYDSDSIVGPNEVPATGKQYYTALFVEKEADNDGYSGQSKAHSKTFFEDTHALQFIGAYVHAATDPYYILRDKKQIGRDESKPISAANPARIGRKFTFFLMQDEDFESAYRAALKRLIRDGALVLTEDAPEEDEVAKLEALNAHQKTSKK
jgi:hypothetical protein